MGSPLVQDVLASIECRSRNSPSGQSFVSFEVTLNGNISGRMMTQGSNQISFNVYHPNSSSIILGENGNAYTFTGNVGNNYTVIPITFPALIPTNQNVIDGPYQKRYQFRLTHPQKNGTRTRKKNVGFRVNTDKVCQVSATDLNFGTYYASNTSPTDSVGTFSFQCTPNITGIISVNQGTGSQSYTNRVLSNSNNKLNYNIYTNVAHSIIFGDGSGGSQAISGNTTGGQQSFNYYGQIPSKQYVRTGYYSSSLVATLTL